MTQLNSSERCVVELMNCEAVRVVVGSVDNSWSRVTVMS